MIKNKKIIASIVGVVVVLGIAGGMISEKIGNAENEYISALSVVSSIKDNTLDIKKELLDIQDEIVKLNKDKANTVNIDKIIEEIEKEDYLDKTKSNNYVKQLDILNEEMDNIIDIYNQNENMKKNMTITNYIIDIESLNNMVDNRMNEYNREYAQNFNEAIKKFPVNLAVKSKGWFELDKFSSVN